jgi:lysine 2,3-aminomutase
VKIPSDIQKKYPFLTSKHFLSLAKNAGRGNSNPILAQVMPSKKELIRDPRLKPDPHDELFFFPLPKLLRRYHDRALILCTNNCFMHCRFCFRKRLWNDKKWDISDAELAKICSYLRKHPEIKEVILSGGDPITLEKNKLFRIISEIDLIKSVDVIRIGSRVLSAYPATINKNFVKKMSSISQKLWFMTHFNHALELSAVGINAIKLLNTAGIPLLNQTVLLKGVNDNVDSLASLFRKLVSLRVKPHYLFLPDPIEGSSHFRVTLNRTHKIIRELKEKLSSIAMPTVAIDMPGKKGKIIISPNFENLPCDFRKRR